MPLLPTVVLRRRNVHHASTGELADLRQGTLAATAGDGKHHMSRACVGDLERGAVLGLVDLDHKAVRPRID